MPKLGWAAGRVLARHGSRKSLSVRYAYFRLYAGALEAGLAAAGCRPVYRTYANASRRLFDAGLSARRRVSLSRASHNPVLYDNLLNSSLIDGNETA
ncbi:hypothetical protein KCP73_15610 [Salmonella enterica subsp. enterica]|nr:hypothetical protein KCP73_15610 [Salmonella enterica subsp. enterica]